MNIYALGYISMSQYYIILLLKLFQLWPLGALPVSSCVPLPYTHFLTLIIIMLFFIPFLSRSTVCYSSREGRSKRKKRSPACW